AIVLGLAALAVFVRFLVFFAENPHTAGRGHIQSLIAGAVLFIGAMLLGSLGVIGDLLDAQRTLSQRTFERVRRIELQLRIAPSHYEQGAPIDIDDAGASESAAPRPDEAAAQRSGAPNAPRTPDANGPGDREALGV